MTTATKAKRETWRDWMPGEPPDGMHIMSRDELLAELQGQGVDVSARTLEYWQLAGVLPYPVRQMYEGAVRATYPYWIIPAIKHLRDLQARGLPLDRIEPWMRSWAYSPYDWKDPFGDAIKAARAALMNYVRAYEDFTGEQVGGVEVVLTDNDGNALTGSEFGFPVTPRANDT